MSPFESKQTTFFKFNLLSITKLVKKLFIKIYVLNIYKFTSAMKLSRTTKILDWKNIKEKIETSFENKFTKDGSNYIFKKGNYIYKGTKYFYKPEDEKQFFDTLPFGYYGDKYVAYYYSKRYSGGLQVYKLRKDLK